MHVSKQTTCRATSTRPAMTFPYRLIEIQTPRGIKRLHHDVQLSTLQDIARRYGWRLSAKQGRLVMIAQEVASDLAA